MRVNIRVKMPNWASTTFVIWMVDVTIIYNLIPDRASFDHFFSTLRKQKKISQFLTNLHQILGDERWINHLTFDRPEFFKMPRKKLLRFKYLFFLHLCVSHSGTHGICDTRLWNRSSRLGISDVFTGLGQKQKYSCVRSLNYWMND